MSENTEIMKDPLNQSLFTTVDYSLFVILILVSMIIGIAAGIKGFREATTKDFLVGSRNLHPVPVAMSLIGGVISALSVLGNPTEIYLNGTQLWLNLLGCFWGLFVIMFVFLPVLYPLDLISMMQYLELRYDSKLLKKLGSISQLLGSSLYLAICLYTPSLALSSVTGLHSWLSIVILGLVCTIYIAFGGVRAVVYTDVFQTSVMFFGVLAVVIQISLDLGGLSNVFEIADQGQRIEFFNFDTSPFTRHTFWSVQVLGFYFMTSSVGLSQAQFQRFVSVKSLRTSQRLCVMFFVGLVVLWSIFNLSGLAAYAAYADCDPLTSKKIEKADQIIPFLVADKLRNIPGMAGLFVAAIYGAVLSSVSSQSSSFAALLWQDFFVHWKWFNAKVKISSTNMTRILSAIAGLLGIVLAFLVEHLGTLFQASYSISAALVSPLDGLFIVGITAPWVNRVGAICGFVVAFIFNIWLVVGKFLKLGETSSPLPLSVEGCNLTEITEFPMTNHTHLFNQMKPQPAQESPEHSLYDISYCYIGTMGVIIVFIVSTVVSLITGPVNPNTLDDSLVFRPSMRLYKKIWGVTHGKDYELEEVKKTDSS